MSSCSGPAKSPWFKFYANDWLGSRVVRLMTPEQRGYYIQLLAESWESKPRGCLPSDPGTLWRLAGARSRKRFEEHGQVVLDQFRAQDCYLIHPKLLELAEARRVVAEERRVAGERGAAARWGAGDGGKQMANAISRPWQTDGESESDSDSESESENRDAAAPTGRRGGSSVDLKEVFERTYQTYPRHVGKRAAEKAFHAACLRHGKNGKSPQEMAELIAERVGVFASTPAGRQGTYTPHLSTWLNADRFFDDPTDWMREEGSGNGNGRDNKVGRSRRAIQEAAAAMVG